MRERIGTRNARRLDIELLQLLHRKSSAVGLQQRYRPLSLRGFIAVLADGVEQDVGVEEVPGAEPSARR